MTRAEGSRQLETIIEEGLLDYGHGHINAAPLDEDEP